MTDFLCRNFDSNLSSKHEFLLKTEDFFLSKMKRSRDDVYMGSQLKRPVISSTRAEP